MGLGKLWNDLGKEAVVVEHDLANAFSEDLKKEMEKEMMKLGKKLMQEEQLEKADNSELPKEPNDSEIICNGNTENTDDIVQSEDVNEAVVMVDEYEDVAETADEIVKEANDILDESVNIIADIKDVADEGSKVFDHIKTLIWKMVKLVHVLISLILPVLAVLHFTK